MATEAEAIFGLNLESNAAPVTAEVADKLEALRLGVLKSQEALKAQSASLRLLKGDSDAVTSARVALKASMDNERAAISSATLKIIEQKTSLVELTKRQNDAKKAADDLKKSQKESGDVFRLSTGPVSELGKTVKDLTTAFGEEGAGAAAATGGLSLLIAAAVALTVGFAAATVEASKFVAVQADLAKNAQLSREAISLSAEDAKNWGDQIELIRQKVPLTADQLNKMFLEIRTNLDGARISGVGIQNVLEGVALATGAGADKAAAKIKEIIDRGKEAGRIGIDLGRGINAKGELAGTGISGQEIAKNLAKNLNISLTEAESELRRHRVPIEAGALAIRQATDKAFAGINEKKLLTFDALSNKLHDDWVRLSKDVDLSGLYKSIQSIEDLLTDTTVTGQAVKQIFEVIGQAIGGAAVQGEPLLQVAIENIILGVQDLIIWFLEARKAVKDTFNGYSVDQATIVNISLIAIKDTALALGLVMASLAVSVAIAVAPFVALGAILITAYEGFKKAYEAAKIFYQLITDPGIQTNIKVPQLVGGGAANLTNGQGQSTVAGPPQITAPAHAVGGVVAKPAPGEYFASVAPGERIVPEDQGSAAPSGGGMIQASIDINVMVGPGGDAAKGQEVVAAIQGSSLLADITKLFDDLAKGSGVPSNQQPVAG